MRRKDREITEFEDIVSVLSNCQLLHLALCENNLPYIVPLNFGFVTTEKKLTIYLHSASQGKKLEIIAQNSNVCFDATCNEKIVGGEKPAGWTTLYSSVIGFGKASILDSESEKIAGLNAIMEHVGFKGHPVYSPQNLKAVVVLKIDVTDITGKSNS